jgi:hypothetical protein
MMAVHREFGIFASFYGEGKEWLKAILGTWKHSLIDHGCILQNVLTYGNIVISILMILLMYFQQNFLSLAETIRLLFEDGNFGELTPWIYLNLLFAQVSCIFTG